MIRALQELNELLKKNNYQLSLICVGGFVLNYYNIRGTMDIDAFYDESVEINKIIQKVGEKYGINPPDELWVNNSVQNMNKKPPKDICKKVFSYSNLKIYIPPLEYIAGMKLISARENDIMDVAHIIRFLKLKDIMEFSQNVNKYNLGVIDESLVIEAFGEAYGLEWLQQYYFTKENNIISNIKNNPSEYKHDLNEKTKKSRILR